MFFGQKSQKMPQAAETIFPQAAPGAFIFDVNAADFETRVLAPSGEKPVVVDFWSPRGAACKPLMSVLESLVTATKGEVLLAKINIDKNPELAQALQIKSVPTVYAFFGGRPVDAFQGPQPESQLKAFIDKLVQVARASKPDSVDIPETLKAAAQALGSSDLASAQAFYAQVLMQDEKNVEAYVGMVRVFVAASHLDQAEGLILSAPPEIAKHPNFTAARTALELARKAPAGDLAVLRQKTVENPQDQQAKIDLAEAQYAAGDKEGAFETLLESIAQDREWNDSAARKALLHMFEALGHADPLVIMARKKLSRLLFS